MSVTLKNIPHMCMMHHIIGDKYRQTFSELVHSNRKLRMLFDVVDSNRPSSPRLGRGKAKTVLIISFACAFVKGKGTGKKDEHHEKKTGNNGKKEKNYKPPEAITCTGGNVVTYTVDNSSCFTAHRFSNTDARETFQCSVPSGCTFDFALEYFVLGGGGGGGFAYGGGGGAAQYLLDTATITTGSNLSGTSKQLQKEEEGVVPMIITPVWLWLVHRLKQKHLDVGIAVCVKFAPRPNRTGHKRRQTSRKPSGTESGTCVSRPPHNYGSFMRHPVYGYSFELFIQDLNTPQSCRSARLSCVDCIQLKEA
eukprot:g70289.t1